MTTNIIAYCGLDCSECRASRATQAKDSKWKEQIANEWNEGLNVEFKPQDIDCMGCMSSVISGWCREICKIRPCAEQKRVKTCAYCNEYQCERLKEFLVKEPTAMKNLEDTRKTLSK